MDAIEMKSQILNYLKGWQETLQNVLDWRLEDESNLPCVYNGSDIASRKLNLVNEIIEDITKM